MAERHGVRLRSSGGDCWKGRCPLPGHPHPEGASSSFKVYRQGGWECSGCGLAGPDGISLEQAITGLDFPSTVQALAEACKSERGGSSRHAARPGGLPAHRTPRAFQPPPTSPVPFSRFNGLYIAREDLAEAHEIIIQGRAFVLRGPPAGAWTCAPSCAVPASAHALT